MFSEQPPKKIWFISAIFNSKTIQFGRFNFLIFCNRILLYHPSTVCVWMCIFCDRGRDRAEQETTQFVKLIWLHNSIFFSSIWYYIFYQYSIWSKWQRPKCENDGFTVLHPKNSSCKKKIEEKSASIYSINYLDANCATKTKKAFSAIVRHVFAFKDVF